MFESAAIVCKKDARHVLCRAMSRRASGPQRRCGYKSTFPKSIEVASSRRSRRAVDVMSPVGSNKYAVIRTTRSRQVYTAPTLTPTAGTAACLFRYCRECRRRQPSCRATSCVMRCHARLRGAALCYAQKEVVRVSTAECKSHRHRFIGSVCRGAQHSRKDAYEMQCQASGYYARPAPPPGVMPRHVTASREFMSRQIMIQRPAEPRQRGVKRVTST